MMTRGFEEWEELNAPHVLPPDVKGFYNIADGLILKWYVSSQSGSVGVSSNDNSDAASEEAFENGTLKGGEKSEKERVSKIMPKRLVGNGKINSLKDLRKVSLDCKNPWTAFAERGAVWGNRVKIRASVKGGRGRSSSADMLGSDDENDDEESAESGIAAFVIDSSPEYGVVALVYGAPKKNSNRSNSNSRMSSSDKYAGAGDGAHGEPEVWFKDRACRWHPIAKSFTCYFRLMLVHLAIQGWQYNFTDIGCDPICKLWMQRYAPERLVVDLAHATS
jgi:hypothetical protein